MTVCRDALRWDPPCGARSFVSLAEKGICATVPAYVDYRARIRWRDLGREVIALTFGVPSVDPQEYGRASMSEDCILEGSAIKSISTIMPSATVNPTIEIGSSLGPTMTPAAPFTSTGCARWASGDPFASTRRATEAAPAIVTGIPRRPRGRVRSA